MLKQLSEKEVPAHIRSLIDGLVPKIQDEIASELKPFLDGVRALDADSREFRLFKETYSEFEEMFERKKKIFDLIAKVKTTHPLDLRDTMYLLFMYLGTVESVGNCMVDILVMLLVANEKDFHVDCQHTTPRIRHALSIKDLEEEKVPLSTKLNFLRDNGIKEFTSIIDSDLRNAIAHLKFDVKGNEIYIKGKSASGAIEEEIVKLLAAIAATVSLLKQLAIEKGLT